MRTVTFSNPDVAKTLTRDFVCAWLNKTPKAKYADGMYDQIKSPRGLPLGTGVTNVTAIFATADGTVLHAIPGYLDPAGFLRHLEFAKSLYAKLFDSKLLREDRARIYAEAHMEAARTQSNWHQEKAHKLLSARFMRVDEFPKEFFHGLGEPG